MTAPYGKHLKTEHGGAKNASHDKWAKRTDLKKASRRLRRRQDREAVRS